MQKSLVFFALLLLPISAHAQSTSRQRVAFVVAPTISYLASNHYQLAQTPKMGFHMRLDGEWKLKQRLWLRVGVGFSQWRFNTDIGKFLQWPSQVVNGVYDPSLPGEQLFKQYSTEMLALPVALRVFIDKEQRFYGDLETGASLVFRKENDALRPTFGAALGFQVTAFQQYQFFVQPSIRMVLHEQLELERTYPYALALEMGIRKGLR